MTIINEPALLELFTRLREAGLPLGMGEYHLLLQALQGGFGASDRQSLSQLCCTLWIKSESEQQIFQAYFEQLVPQSFEQSISEPIASSSSSQPIGLLDGNFSPSGQQTQNPSQPSRIKRYLIPGVVSLMLVTGSSLAWWLRPKPPVSPGTVAFTSFTSFMGFSSFHTWEDKHAVISVSRTQGSKGAISVTVVLEESELTTATPDDFINTSITVKFADSKAGNQSFTIPIQDDKEWELREIIHLKLAAPQGGVQLGTANKASLTIIDNDSSWVWILEWSFIAPLCLLIGLIVRRKLQQMIKDTSEQETPTQTQTNLPQKVLSPEVMRLMTDEVQVAKAIGQSDNQSEEKLPLIIKDIPVTYRQMKQGWRYLRQFVREGVATELDMAATLQQIGQQGFLLNPVLMPRRTNRLELLLLIDREGSMVPFHHLSRGLLETASRGGRFSKVRAYYFHNCPMDYLYKDPFLVEAEPIEDCFSQFPKTKIVCMIFSDAGAARGAYNSKRRRQTKFALEQLKQSVRHVAWLNPVPRPRWQNTTATEIANLIPMFEVNRLEFYQAIRVLCGRHLHTNIWIDSASRVEP